MSVTKSDSPTSPAALERLGTHVAHRVGSRLRDFEVATQGNGLVLRGWTRTYHAKQLAQHFVMAEVDLPIILNCIEVR